MTSRCARIERTTSETSILLNLELDGQGTFQGTTGLGFLDHMLHLLSHHAGVDLEIEGSGDLQVDDHHLIEDVGLVLGQALLAALGDRKGLVRYGSCTLPMDEVLLTVALDLSGRFAFASNYQPARERVGDFSTEMACHFFRSLACEARMALHFHYLNPGNNEHHRLEAQFKGFARALRQAVARDARFPERIPSSKGTLEGTPE